MRKSSNIRNLALAYYLYCSSAALFTLFRREEKRAGRRMDGRKEGGQRGRKTEGRDGK